MQNRVSRTGKQTNRDDAKRVNTDEVERGGEGRERGVRGPRVSWEGGAGLFLFLSVSFSSS